MKTYTRTGDTGETALAGGQRVPKDHPKVESCGTIDELNTVLGICNVHITNPTVTSLLKRIQNELFVVGAEVATPGKGCRRRTKPVTYSQIRYLEKQIDVFEKDLRPSRGFIVPAGSLATVYLHFARAVCRRAERRLVTLSHQTELNPQVLRYLNRLSDLLFVLARWMNQHSGIEEMPWTCDTDSRKGRTNDG